jgi:hypothetical protein
MDLVGRPLPGDRRPDPTDVAGEEGGTDALEVGARAL